MPSPAAEATVGRVVYGHVAGEFRRTSWVLGLLGFPALLLACSGGGAAHPDIRMLGALISRARLP
ncbi:MAG: hypothetical protein M3O70_01670 [Actinomycetota bacterium]|nr:hypothetical protein [Actinomycetota bacterium]